MVVYGCMWLYVVVDDDADDDDNDDGENDYDNYNYCDDSTYQECGWNAF